jgi:hypothetical protein
MNNKLRKLLKNTNSLIPDSIDKTKIKNKFDPHTNLSTLLKYDPEYQNY